MGRVTKTTASLAIVLILIFMTAPVSLQYTRSPVLEVLTGTNPTLAQEYTESLPIRIEGNLFFANGPWNGSGTSVDPYLIEGLMIEATESAIEISGTDAHFVISDCVLVGDYTGDSVGILLSDVTNGHIRNVIVEHTRYGIRIASSVNNTVSNVSVSGNFIGLQIDQSNRTSADWNRLFGNTYGIHLVGARECNLTENVIYGNEVVGILMDGESQNCTALRNTIGWNGPSATTPSNAMDNGAFNLWYDVNESAGNMWSDYIGAGRYEINGTSNSFDLYPGFLTDFIQPTVDSPEDLRLEEGGNPESILWNASDEYARMYEVLLDGVRIISDIWRGGTVNVTAFPERVGAYNYTLIIQDAVGNTAMDTVYVVVILPMFGGLGTTQILVSSAMSVLAVILVVVIIKKMR
ncbi:MAG: right-handed parallel beta-helix repeat-containing protein [Candidatus Thorarchaeota archaeon]|nr:MAG: right-handed parallel beta-helix repeat-containing protein [Candidatus Thorarchaeota archaeon]